MPPSETLSQHNVGVEPQIKIASVSNAAPGWLNKLIPHDIQKQIKNTAQYNLIVMMMNSIRNP